ncbi:MAG: hypothetical protein N0E55_12445, partial [Candidatus Thiodiazotropha taylori]|nr:hypothetical protein [Candidatus Thiodiazotropha taylori]MCW4253494.1 hypothetical protein [Candidatus Thiodiazotropha taylori]
MKIIRMPNLKGVIKAMGMVVALAVAPLASAGMSGMGGMSGMSGMGGMSGMSGMGGMSGMSGMGGMSGMSGMGG